MSFISFKPKKNNITEKKLPPAAAWKHYDKKQGSRATSASSNEERPVLISLDDVTLSYEGTNVIENLSLDIREGDYLCVIGENGSGKSTLMNSILGLKKQTSGKIKFHGINRKQIGVLPQQNPVAKDFPALVEEVVISGCLNRCSKGGFMSREAKQIAFQNMERLGITPLARHAYRDLSGGQQQRVALARALCAAEKMLVLDEPTAGLDAKSTADIYSLIHDLNRREGMTVITVTHDIPAALKYGTKILRINKQSIFFGTVEEYSRLDEARPYIMLAESNDDPETAFGDGGFRFAGGEK